MVWILPTISRPRQTAEVLRRIIEHGCSTPGYVVVEGDGEGYGHLPMPQNWGVIFTRHFTDKKLGAIGTFNFAFNLFPNEPWYGFMSDDEFLMPESALDWDERLVNAAGRWDIAHGWESLNQGKRGMHGYPCIGGDLVRAVGYLGVSTCWHSFGIDSMWEWLTAPRSFGGGDCCRSYYVPEVKIEHRHYRLGTAENDQCYKNADDHFEEDRVAFAEWQKNEMQKIGERVRSLRGIEREVT